MSCNTAFNVYSLSKILSNKVFPISRKPQPLHNVSNNTEMGNVPMKCVHLIVTYFLSLVLKTTFLHFHASEANSKSYPQQVSSSPLLPPKESCRTGRSFCLNSVCCWTLRTTTRVRWGCTGDVSGLRDLIFCSARHQYRRPWHFGKKWTTQIENWMLPQVFIHSYCISKLFGFVHNQDLNSNMSNMTLPNQINLYKTQTWN